MSQPGVYFYIADAPYDRPRGYLVKIGRSTNPISRALELQTACPYRIGQLWVFEPKDGNEIKLERIFHDTFKDYRINREWFGLYPDIIGTVRDHCFKSWPISRFYITEKNRPISWVPTAKGEWYFDTYYAENVLSVPTEFPEEKAA